MVAGEYMDFIIANRILNGLKLTKDIHCIENTQIQVLTEIDRVRRDLVDCAERLGEAL